MAILTFPSIALSLLKPHTTAHFSLLRSSSTKSNFFISLHRRSSFRFTRAISVSALSTSTTIAEVSNQSSDSESRVSIPTFQQAIQRLQEYWASVGCTIMQCSNTEVGAGTMNPLTFLRVLGPEPWNVAIANVYSVLASSLRYSDPFLSGYINDVLRTPLTRIWCFAVFIDVKIPQVREEIFFVLSQLTSPPLAEKTVASGHFRNSLERFLKYSI
ncbi:hypothetical protein GIB67_021572 [Kingdonia uniflora]|uniref:glycine--tRNA ligase n=1 Tax=Kingdonia uniflora TaxID=39325 RepID=A0A7J7MDM7_9MAGN|nr:hypothetical protein GIB67_021572 [Kingdonia uniflora]